MEPAKPAFDYELHIKYFFCWATIADPMHRPRHGELSVGKGLQAQMKSRKWPACFSTAVNTKKVAIEAVSPWVSEKVTELMAEGESA